MKKTISLILVTVLALCLFTGCTPKAPVDTSPDKVRIVMEAAEHTPEHNWLYRYEDGVSADGTRLSVEEMLAKTEGSRVIPAPFTVVTGNALENGAFSIYDLEGNLIGQRMTFSVPEEGGEYLCVMELTFGTEKEYEGYQFFFRFSVEEEEVYCDDPTHNH